MGKANKKESVASFAANSLIKSGNGASFVQILAGLKIGIKKTLDNQSLMNKK
jgi:4-amino-4-deoxy-L-arabinose transferase-like glycosyltransferase